MKKIDYLIGVLVLMAFQQIHCQFKSLDEPFAYRFNGHIQVYHLDEETDNFEKSNNDTLRKKYFGLNTLFYKSGIYYEEISKGKRIKYYKISPVVYVKNILVDETDYEKYGRSKEEAGYIKGAKLYRKKCKGEACKKKNNSIWVVEKTEIISQKDQNSIFLLESAEFENLEGDGFIFKEYQMWDWDVDFGAQLSLPFKLRAKLDEDNMRITPEINLGGFISSRYRIDKRKNRYLHFPIVSAGVSGIGINTDNKIDESKNTGDGLIMATTFTVGTAVELENFQLGIILGWDKASGDIGKNWKYNGRPWLSFGIGFTFLGKKEKEKTAK